MVLQDLNTNQRVVATKEIDLSFWDRVSPIIVSGSGSGSSNTEAGFGSIMEALIGAEDEFGNDVLPLTQIAICRHGITNRASSCSITWSFEEDISGLIGPISNKIKFFIMSTDKFLLTRQVRNSFTIDEFNIQPFIPLPEVTKLIPNFQIIGAQIVTRTDPLFSSAEVIFRITVSSIGLFQQVEYEISAVVRDDDLPDIMIEQTFPGVAFVNVDETLDFSFTDAAIFALKKPRLDLRISIDGNVISEKLNIPLARVEFVEPEPEPEPLPTPIPEPIPEPELPPIEPIKNNTLRNVGIAGGTLIAVVALTRLR